MDLVLSDMFESLTYIAIGFVATILALPGGGPLG
jgi:hypothetical protein